MDVGHWRDVSSGMGLKLIPPLMLAQHWEVVEPLLARAAILTRGRFSTEDIKALVLEGKYALTVVLDEDNRIVGAMTTAIENYPGLRALQVTFLGGRLGVQWQRLALDGVERLARAANCSKIEFRGRKEWGMVLAPDGYEHLWVAYEKVLPPCDSIS